MNIFLKKIWWTLLGTSFFLKIQYVLIPNILGGGLVYNEYLDISVYLFDVSFLVGLIYILNNENRILSSIQELFHVKHNRVLLLAPLAVLCISTLSVYFSLDRTLSLRQLLILLEGVVMYYGIIVLFMFHVKQNKKIVSRETGSHENYLMLFVKGIYGVAIINSLVAIGQFLLQRDLYFYIFGESHLQIGSSNIATIDLFGHKLLRAYGLFPHPNILAALLLLSLVMLIIFKNDLVPRETKFNSITSVFHVKQWGVLCLVVALILTFSKTALILGGLFYFMSVSRETLIKLSIKKFHVKHLFFLCFILIFIFSVSQKSFSEREFSLLEYVQSNTIAIFGNGIGTSYLQQALILQSTKNPWILQPVHNGYLIILSEIGVLGLCVYTYLFLQLLLSSSNTVFHVKQWTGGHFLVFCIVVLALGDHYFFTIPQGVFLFWIFLALGSIGTLDIDNN